MDNVEAREETMQLARTDPERALAVSRGIRDPWYRCQALAWVGRFANARTAEPALAEAAAAAAEGGDAFRRLTVLAWPIRAAIERGAGGLAGRWIDRALAEIAAVEPLPSRAETLWWLWSAAFPGPPSLRGKVIAAALAHCPPDRSWRAERLFRTMAATIAQADPEAASALIEAMPDGRARARIARRRAAGEQGPPQPFFW